MSLLRFISAVSYQAEKSTTRRHIPGKLIYIGINLRCEVIKSPQNSINHRMPKRRSASTTSPCALCEGLCGVNAAGECVFCGFKDPLKKHTIPQKRARREQSVERETPVKGISPPTALSDAHCVITPSSIKSSPDVTHVDEIGAFLREQGVYTFRDGAYVMALCA